MTNAEMLRPYVAEQVASILGLETVKIDSDGDIPVRHGSAVSFVRVVDGPMGPYLRVFAPVLRSVQKSEALLNRLNELNASSPYVRFFWSNDQIFCSSDTHAEDLQRSEINNALGAVGWHSDNLDDALKNDFGGERMVEEEELAKPTSSGAIPPTSESVIRYCSHDEELEAAPRRTRQPDRSAPRLHG